MSESVLPPAQRLSLRYLLLAVKQLAIAERSDVLYRAAQHRKWHLVYVTQKLFVAFVS